MGISKGPFRTVFSLIMLGFMLMLVAKVANDERLLLLGLIVTAIGVAVGNHYHD